MTDSGPETEIEATEQAEPEPPARGWSRIFRHLDNMFEHTATKRLVAVCEIISAVGVIVGVIAGIVHLVGPDGSQASSPPTSTSTEPPTTAPPSTVPTSSSPSPSSPAASIPRCWTAARAVVDCREKHQFEEIPGASQCSQAIVIAFMGGRSDLDVTLARPAKSPPGSCAVDAARVLSTSVKDVLAKGSAASWRRYNDNRRHKLVPCSELHSTEYFGTGSLRRATTEECELAAVQYMDQTPANVTDELQIRAIDVPGNTPDTARCAIDARGNHLLNDSVRNLGSHPVPIYSS